MESGSQNASLRGASVAAHAPRCSAGLAVGPPTEGLGPGRGLPFQASPRNVALTMAGFHIAPRFDPWAPALATGVVERHTVAPAWRGRSGLDTPCAPSVPGGRGGALELARPGTRRAGAARAARVLLGLSVLGWAPSCSDLGQTCDPAQTEMVLRVAGTGARFSSPAGPWPRVLSESSQVEAQWRVQVGAVVTTSEVAPLDWAQSPYGTPELAVRLRERECGVLALRLATTDPVGEVSAAMAVCGEPGVTLTAWWALGPSAADPVAGCWEHPCPAAWVEGERLCVDGQCLSPYIVVDRRSLLGDDVAGSGSCAFACELRVFPPDGATAEALAAHLAGTCDAAADERVRLELPGGGEVPAGHAAEVAVVVLDPALTPAIFARLVQFMESHGAPASLVAVRGRRPCP